MLDLVPVFGTVALQDSVLDRVEYRTVWIVRDVIRPVGVVEEEWEDDHVIVFSKGCLILSACFLVPEVDDIGKHLLQNDYRIIFVEL